MPNPFIKHLKDYWPVHLGWIIGLSLSVYLFPHIRLDYISFTLGEEPRAYPALLIYWK